MMIKMTAMLLALTSAAIAADAIEVVQPISRGVTAADRPTVNRCNAAIAEWAAQYHPLRIRTSLTKAVESVGGGHKATLAVVIAYPTEGGVEPRAATIACTVSARGKVGVELLSEG